MNIRPFLLICALCVFAPGLLLPGCASPYPGENPLGKPFPKVSGTSLDGRSLRLPEDLAGKPTLLLVGYEMNSQFDCDRWILGVQQAEIDVQLYEVPTIEGLVPGLFAGKIDDGMRRGIPREDWPVVVTVYDDAGEITRFLGNENPRNTRVVLLDADSRIVYFHDGGYSASHLLRLKKKIESLGG